MIAWQGWNTAPMLGATSNTAALNVINNRVNNRATNSVATGTGGGTGGGFQVPQSLGGGTTPEQIIQLVNQINQAAQQTANAGRIPQGAALEQLSSGNISSALSGQLDQSVINQLAQRQAERGAQMGIATGSPSNNAAYLKAIGLNSLDLMNQGQNWLSQATARNPAAPIYNAGNMALTPQQQAQIDLQNRQLQEQIRSNQARESLSRQSQNRGNGGWGGGGQAFTGKPPYTQTDPRFQPQMPDLFAPVMGNGGGGAAATGSGWSDDPFDWAWNDSTSFQSYQPEQPAWTQPNLGGNITDGSLYGGIGFNATSNWEDDPFAWAWE